VTFSLAQEHRPCCRRRPQLGGYVLDIVALVRSTLISSPPTSGFGGAGILGYVSERKLIPVPFTADPYLTGEASYETIKGIQSQGVQATAK
jgi:hypothetical protein